MYLSWLCCVIFVQKTMTYICTWCKIKLLKLCLFIFFLYVYIIIYIKLYLYTSVFALIIEYYMLGHASSSGLQE